MIPQSRLHHAHRFAEPQYDAEFVGLDPEQPGKAPEHDHRHRDQERATAAEIAGHDAAQSILAAAKKFFEIGRPRALLLRTRAPGAARPRTPRTAAALIAPRHSIYS